MKPTSTYSVRVTDQLDVLAHISEALPRMWVADSPALQQFLTNELTYELALAVEAMAISDIAATSGIQTNSYSTSTLATPRKSVTKLESNGYPPAKFVLHSGDFESIELALSTVNAVEHMSLPYDAAARRLWGVPITVTNAQTAGVAHSRVGCGRIEHRQPIRASCMERNEQRRRLEQEPDLGALRRSLRHRRFPAARCRPV